MGHEDGLSRLFPKTVGALADLLNDSNAVGMVASESGSKKPETPWLGARR
jgi:hypothetical protein